MIKTLMCHVCLTTRRRFGQMLAGAAALLGARAAGAVGRGLPTVVLDAGHGGHDPGAISPSGTYEKTITLASALALQASLLATRRYRVVMTRTDDEFVTLENRVAAAVAAGGDLFIALHCDHLPSADFRGASIYTLSADASDGLAAGLARDQNSVDRAGGAGPGAAVSPQVARILASLETRATRIGSATFARDIAASFAGTMPLLPDPIRSANFAVLRDPSIPSALLEMGCLTNKLDEKILTSASHRAEMAGRITDAIDIYFRSYAQGATAG